MSPEEFEENYYEIGRELNQFHEIFYKFWNVGRPIFTEDIPTAAVSFDQEEGEHISFLFNPKFLEELSDHDVRFIICHELLHVILNHGKRTLGDKLNKDLINVALDVVINESLVQDFGFRRESKLLKEDCCFLDNVFKDIDVSPNKFSEYYYNKLKENSKQVKVNIQGPEGLGNGGSLDDHSGLQPESKAQQNKDQKKRKELLEEVLGEDKAKKLEEQLNRQAGEGSLKNLLDTVIERVRKNMSFESLTKKIARTYKAQLPTEEYQWVTPDRRFNCISSDFLIPQLGEVEENENKINLWFFQDVSGSCINDAQRFQNLARSVPSDLFKVNFFTFDTSVEEADLHGRIYGGGGTSFSCIDNFVNRHLKSGKRHPDAIFVITDGYGDPVMPAKPKKWFWFLSTDYSALIDKNCHICDASNFE